MPLLYIAVIDLCFILDVDVPLICALITAVYRILTFIEKRFDQRETRQDIAGTEIAKRSKWELVFATVRASVHASHMPHIIFSLSEHILDHKGVRPKYFR